MQSLFSCIGKRFSCLHLCSDGAGSTTRISRESPKKDKDRFGLQKEVLESLFCVPERSTQVPKIIHVVRPERRPRGFGKPVTEPYEDTITGPIVAERKMDARDGNNFQILREYSASLIICMELVV